MYNSGGDTDNGVDYACVVQGIYEKSLHLPFKYAVKVKLLWKIKSIKEKEPV